MRPLAYRIRFRQRAQNCRSPDIYQTMTAILIRARLLEVVGKAKTLERHSVSPGLPDQVVEPQHKASTLAQLLPIAMCCSQSTSLARVFLVMVLTPISYLLAVLITDSIPLQAPERDIRHTHGCSVRAAFTTFIDSFGMQSVVPRTKKTAVLSQYTASVLTETGTTLATQNR